jgi:hypothetical protein
VFPDGGSLLRIGLGDQTTGRFVEGQVDELSRRPKQPAIQDDLVSRWIDYGPQLSCDLAVDLDLSFRNRFVSRTP